MIAVQTQDFDLAEEYRQLTLDNCVDGAVVTFVGMVRDFNDGSDVSGLFLEHYPGMTEKALAVIVSEAKKRWPLGRVRLVHRVGQLTLGEQIVFVGVSAKHRGDAFDGCEFIMDKLKTEAPFWKKETTADGERWVDAKQSDNDKADTWSA